MKPGLAPALGAIVLLAGLVSGCSNYHDGDRPGTAYERVSVDDRGAHKTVFQLPVGTLTITTGKPVHEIDDNGDPHHAADGAVVVPVKWYLEAGTLQNTDDIRVGDDALAVFPLHQFRVTLRAAGQRYDLQAGQPVDSPAHISDPDPAESVDGSKTLAVVVQGDGRNLSYAVDYDGLTQTGDVDSGRITPGAAAGYYRTRTPTTLTSRTTCSLLSSADARRYSGGRSTTCTVGPVLLVPYVAGLGWVRSAHETWAVTSFDAGSSEFHLRPGAGDGPLLLATRLDATLTLDGHAVVAERSPAGAAGPDNPAGPDRISIFRVDRTPTTLQVRTVVHTIGDRSGAKRDFVNVSSLHLA